jgi:putative transposase
MARKRYKPEDIVAKLRQVDVLVSQGQAMADAIRQIALDLSFALARRQHPNVATINPRC